jgi:LPXTG-motif cell wall-anchored protein
VQVAVVTPPATNSGNQKTLLIGLALLVAALAIGILWLRRSRQAPHASLITRSLDKDK